jgi:hypothetical protein
LNLLTPFSTLIDSPLNYTTLNNLNSEINLKKTSLDDDQQNWPK